MGSIARTFALAVLALCPLQARAVSVIFDYSQDDSGLFASDTAQGQAARARLQDAAGFFAFSDPLAAIAPAGANHWTARMGDSETGIIDVPDLQVPADTLVVFALGQPLEENLLGKAGPGQALPQGGSTAAFQQILAHRGQGEADFGPWGGLLVFDSDRSWHLGGLDAEPGSLDSDFLSVAIHELAHVFGFGSAASFDVWIEDQTFNGPRTMEVFGNRILLDPDLGHWEDGTLSHLPGSELLQETALDPSLEVGARKLLTELDLAGLQDTGWVLAVPEPTPTALLLLALLAARRRVRRWRRRATPIA